ncbi:unnamed protein product [Ilex paraguariensis]|uniref:ribonuclease P n=1 Tax=Ilex paraguariensis TaxID=185542 RepID=A0ABC8TYY2_9AQUA
MVSFTFKPLQQTQLFSFTICKYPSTLNSFKFQYPASIHTFSRTKHTLQPRCSPFLEVRAQVTHLETELSITEKELSRNTLNQRNSDEIGSGLSSLRPREKGVDKNIEKRVRQNGHGRKRFGFNKRREKGYGISPMRSKDQSLSKETLETKGDNVVSEKIGKIAKNSYSNRLGEEKIGKGSKKNKANSLGALLRVGLDMCSKRGDCMGAIRLYDFGKQEDIKVGQYHYAVLLYLCSSAATGVVQPAKSGSGNRSLNVVYSSKNSSAGSLDFGELEKLVEGNFGGNEMNLPVSNDRLSLESGKIHENIDKTKLKRNNFPAEVAQDDAQKSFNGQKNLSQLINGSLPHPQNLDELIQLLKYDNDSSNRKVVNGARGDNGIQVSEDVKSYAVRRGFEIYEKMKLDNVPMNEAALTSVARMAMSMGDGDLAFDLVKQMKTLGINPRLRSYGPALSVFCSRGDIEKAFTVEEHMLEHGVYTEEPEMEALLRVSVEAGRSDKVYYLLHKLRTSIRQVSPSTADLIEKWFKSKVASRVGKRKWDKKLIIEAIQNGGGGWHGQGWLGRGKWIVSRTSVGADGLCKCCGEKLATIDLDPTETENFAESVAAVAAQREKNSSFQKFQKWLDYHGPFEAVVDGANVGLFSQRRLKPSKINSVVNGIRQMLPSKKWPLIVLHNRRLTGDKMDEPFNKAIIEKWKTADALYATPTGSNDDCYKV